MPDPSTSHSMKMVFIIGGVEPGTFFVGKYSASTHLVGLVCRLSLSEIALNFESNRLSVLINSDRSWGHLDLGLG